MNSLNKLSTLVKNKYKLIGLSSVFILVLLLLFLVPLKAEDCKLCPATVGAFSKTEKLSQDSNQKIICTSCGEYKDSEKCCKPEGRVKCSGCGLFKGSPGCCKPVDKINAAIKAESTKLCACNEIKGSAECCVPKKEIKKEIKVKICGCGEIKGSPNCCK